jgi:hypothetical protein
MNQRRGAIGALVPPGACRNSCSASESSSAGLLSASIVRARGAACKFFSTYSGESWRRGALDRLAGANFGSGCSRSPGAWSGLQFASSTSKMPHATLDLPEPENRLAGLISTEHSVLIKRGML